MPDLAELTRQYQHELENQRRALAAFNDTVSMANELNAIADDVDAAYSAMRVAWHGHVFQKMIEGFAP